MTVTSGRAPRFEIVHTDAGHHARFVAANGEPVWSTEVYADRVTAQAAVLQIARGLPNRSTPWMHAVLLQAHGAVEVRDVDETTSAGDGPHGAERPLRAIPGTPRPCMRCRNPILWAITGARDTGPGGKSMPIDPVEHPNGNVAVSPGHGGRLIARVLKRDETPVTPVEYRAMPHFATCGKAGQ